MEGANEENYRSREGFIEKVVSRRLFRDSLQSDAPRTILVSSKTLNVQRSTPAELSRRLILAGTSIFARKSDFRRYETLHVYPKDETIHEITEYNASLRNVHRYEIQARNSRLDI